MFTKTIVFLITVYQYTLSPDTGILRYAGFWGGVCLFYPTCSEYTKNAVLEKGAARGILLGVQRIAHCHPFRKQNNE